jgi:hypothetical protein
VTAADHVDEAFEIVDEIETLCRTIRRTLREDKIRRDDTRALRDLVAELDRARRAMRGAE